MKIWLRLTLITATVGGGFAGFSITLQSLLSQPLPGPVTFIIYLAFLALYAFVLTSGLIFVQNPAVRFPMQIALAIQIPSLSSGAIVYQFAAGLFAYIAVGDSGLTGSIHLGAQFEFFLFRPFPFNVGINLFPIIMLIAMTWQNARTARIETTIAGGFPVVMPQVPPNDPRPRDGENRGI